jgi:hypothetical protein
VRRRTQRGHGGGGRCSQKLKTPLPLRVPPLAAGDLPVGAVDEALLRRYFELKIRQVCDAFPLPPKVQVRGLARREAGIKWGSIQQCVAGGRGWQCCALLCPQRD